MKATLNRAASQCGQSLSEFVLQASLEKCERMRAEGWRVKELPTLRDGRKERAERRRASNGAAA